MSLKTRALRSRSRKGTFTYTRKIRSKGTGAILESATLERGPLDHGTAFRSGNEGEEKALWVILILVLPVIGMILCFLVGKKK